MCTWHLWTRRKGRTPDPWQLQTCFAGEVLPLLTKWEQKPTRGVCAAEIWLCSRNRHQLPNEFPSVCSPRLPFLSVFHSSSPHVWFSCNSICFRLHQYKEDIFRKRNNNKKNRVSLWLAREKTGHSGQLISNRRHGHHFPRLDFLNISTDISDTEKKILSSNRNIVKCHNPQRAPIILFKKATQGPMEWFTW